MRKIAARARVRGNFQAISWALDQYRQDWNGYPFVDVANGEKGCIALARWLVAPAAAAVDGADGPGFRKVAGGKIYGPYLRPDSFKLFQLDPNNQWVILEDYEHPIEYYPKLKQGPQGYTCIVTTWASINSGQYPMFCQDHGSILDPSGGNQVLLAALGAPLVDPSKPFDINNNRYDNTPASIAGLKFTGDFILASPGLDTPSIKTMPGTTGLQRATNYFDPTKPYLQWEIGDSDEMYNFAQ